ncbi:MAG TPA: hypothetical protein VFG73_02230 [Rhodanobacteraceae bacterium]|nr:hypothetical protein [Rhodanobacteraceae bacterium]
MALMLELEPGDAVRIGTGTTVRLESKTGARARLRIDSDQNIATLKAGATPAERPRLHAQRRAGDLAAAPKPVLRRP